MERELLWNLFLDTGAPEAFLLYRKSCRETGETDEKKAGEMDRGVVCARNSCEPRMGGL